MSSVCTPHTRKQYPKRPEEGDVSCPKGTSSALEGNWFNLSFLLKASVSGYRHFVDLEQTWFNPPPVTNLLSRQLARHGSLLPLCGCWRSWVRSRRLTGCEFSWLHSFPQPLGLGFALRESCSRVLEANAELRKGWLWRAAE